MEAAPSREARHVLTLIAKTMVNMANGIPFGTKEPAMKENLTKTDPSPSPNTSLIVTLTLD